MKLWSHFIVSLLVSSIIINENKIGAVLFFLGSFVIDVDHYILYIIKYRSLNIKKAYQRFIENAKNKSPEKSRKFMKVFHSIEFYLMILLISLFIPLIWFLFAGVIVHLIMDKIMIKWFYNIIKYKSVGSNSVIYWLFNKR